MWLVATVLDSAGLDIGMTHPRQYLICRGDRLFRIAVSYPFHASNGIREIWALRPAARKLARSLTPKV